MRLAAKAAARLVSALSLLAGVGLAWAAAERPVARNVWDLELGALAADLPVEGFMHFACGSNGGPPGRPLNDWRDYAACRPEPSGLHEVAFQYDDEWEYWARAHNQPAQPGTTVYDFPVLLSLLFSESGEAVGIRMVTDARAETRDRRAAYLLARFVRARFGEEGWVCADLEPEEGQSPIGGQMVMTDCAKELPDGGTVTTQARYFRKAGQHEFDPHGGQLTVDQFESTARIEIARPRRLPADD